jgi:hypothetical protein
MKAKPIELECKEDLLATVGYLWANNALDNQIPWHSDAD